MSRSGVADGGSVTVTLSCPSLVMQFSIPFAMGACLTVWNIVYSKSVAQPETIETKIEYLLPGATRRNKVPSWPPDVFCLCAAILQNSGAYSRVVDDSDAVNRTGESKKRAQNLSRIGTAWAKAVSANRQPPRQISNCWSAVFKARKIELHALGDEDASLCRRALMDLLGAADEACAGVGIDKIDLQLRVGGGLAPFRFKAEGILVESMSSPGGATLCKGIDPSRPRVLPKMHTPQSGLTIRSLSHHLGYCPGSDMRPKWASLAPRERSHALNLLLIPWPEVVDPAQFVATRSRGLTDEVRRGGYGLFAFRPSPGPSKSQVAALLRNAERTVGHINGIIFPELSMSEPEFDQISEEFARPDRFVVSGISKSSDDSAGLNSAYWDLIDPRIKDENNESVRYRIIQKKHHRWKLDKGQIVQYGLGANLFPLANWWEHIELGDREISFVALQPWLTMSVLICEDLARPDPVGDIIRAVGPNLIIALLCDGPQIANRWPGRYASGFADDPGSSVLTLTSLGMSRLSRPADASKDRSGVVALWRDAKTGTAEISLPDGNDAVVLNITVEYHEEWTADGRGDGKSSGYPVLSGYHLIKGMVPTEGRTQDDDDLNHRRSDSLTSVQAAGKVPKAQADWPTHSRSKGARGKLQKK